MFFPLVSKIYDTVILGAGAAGMYCAIFAASQGGKVIVLDHAKSPGEKIRISGGGRCNFTNLYAGPENFISGNPHFCKSALKRHTQHDFIELVEKHKIGWHEKTLGQLFCDNSAKDIIALLRDEMARVGAELQLQTSIIEISKADGGFRISVESEGQRQSLACKNLVIATGGKSIPKMGASGFGYQIAEQFGLSLTDTRPALVPLTFGNETQERFKVLAGISVDARVTAKGPAFDEALLFTHRGLSGPAILQASSYWREGEALDVLLLPDTDVFETLRAAKNENGRRAPLSALSELFPKRLAEDVAANAKLNGNLADQSDKKLRALADLASYWSLRPTGSEGYRTAEVTLGGVDTDGLESRSMEAKSVPGLYFIGEVVDVTGWLGGYNFQWAWSSGWAAGTHIAHTS